MIRLRSIAGTALLVSVVFISTLYSACKEKPLPSPDSCAGVVCQNNGVCIQGACDCTAGYTGANCENKANAPYIGKWSVTQEVVSSNGKPLTGVTSTYEMQVTEDPSGVTMLNFSGFMGETSFNSVKGRIGMTLDFIEDASGTFVETEVPTEAANFIFSRYQALGQSKKQLLKGEGAINSLGTQLSGEFYVIYADSTGPVEDKITFTASFVN